MSQSCALQPGDWGYRHVFLPLREQSKGGIAAVWTHHPQDLGQIGSVSVDSLRRRVSDKASLVHRESTCCVPGPQRALGHVSGPRSTGPFNHLCPKERVLGGEVSGYGAA